MAKGKAKKKKPYKFNSRIVRKSDAMRIVEHENRDVKKQLKAEYENPEAFGSMAELINGIDNDAEDATDFECLLSETVESWLLDGDCADCCVLFAMLGREFR